MEVVRNFPAKSIFPLGKSMYLSETNQLCCSSIVKDCSGPAYAQGPRIDEEIWDFSLAT